MSPRPVRRAVVRADASVAIGSGHVVRCLTLARALVAGGAAVTFVCREAPGGRIAALREAGFPVVALPAQAGVKPEQDSGETLAAVGPGGEGAWVICDHYGLDACWERPLRAAGWRILAVDDLADRPHDCDILLDQNVATPVQAGYADLVGPDAVRLLGPEYLLLRPEFAAAAGRPPPGGRRTLLFFGGGDAQGITLRLLEVLVAMDHGIEPVVLVGPGNPQRGAVAELCRRAGYGFHVDPPDVAALTAGCDAAIAACGFFAYELMALGRPALLTAQSPIQWTVAKALEGLGVARALGLDDLFDPAVLLRELAAVRAIRADAPGFSKVSTEGCARVIARMEAVGR